MYKNLASLGLFKTTNLNSLVYVPLLIQQVGNSFFYLIEEVFFCLIYIIPLLQRLSLKKFIFIFIDFDDLNLISLFADSLILKSTYSYIIYDWCYGIISNFRVMFLTTYSYRYKQLPSLGIILNAEDQEHLVSHELRQRGILSLGLISFDKIFLVDYPIFIDPRSELSLVFLKFILRILNSTLEPAQEKQPFHDPEVTKRRRKSYFNQ